MSDVPPPTPPFDPARAHLEISLARAVCVVHGEVFRETWPKGYPVFVLAAFERVVGQEGFQAMSGGEVAKIHELLDQRPLCCRLSPETLLATYVECGVGVVSRCIGCRDNRMGTPYRLREPSGRLRRLSHVCFRCVVHAIRPVPKSPGGDPESAGPHTAP